MCCCLSTPEQAYLLDVVANNDNPPEDHVCTLRGRDVYLRLPSNKSQCCHVAFIFASIAFGVAGAITFQSNPTVSTICLVASGLTYIGGIAQLVLTNMSCKPVSTII